MPAVNQISLKPHTKLESKVRRDGSRQVRNPVQLVTSEVFYQSGSIDFMHDSLLCGRRFRAFDAVDNFKHETLAIENTLNIPAQPVVRVLKGLLQAVDIRRRCGWITDRNSYHWFWNNGLKTMA